ncbi:MAG: hypothetical protein A2Y33_02880 [Spirochaetes bacterium GWF1_51_8]|nr:MAG: hypothetical protein A2Y33_02880 [Spirochaetes bacterium GWF1_51_8]
MKKIIAGSVLSILFLAIAGCCSKPPVKEETPAPPVEEVKKYDEKNYGSVVYIKQDGGFFGIVNDRGEKFVPDLLPDMFRFDGLRVFFDYQVLEFKPGSKKWGVPIQLTVIRIE